MRQELTMDDANIEGKEWEGDYDPLADPEEKRHLLSVLDSFRYASLRRRRSRDMVLTYIARIVVLHTSMARTFVDKHSTLYPKSTG